MARNIEMNYYDGNSYEVLYPSTIPTQIQGTIPIEKGGTNANTAEAGFWNLVSGLTTTVGLNDLYSFLVCSDSGAYKVKLNNETNTFYLKQKLITIERYDIRPTSKTQISFTVSGLAVSAGLGIIIQKYGNCVIFNMNLTEDAGWYIYESSGNYNIRTDLTLSKSGNRFTLESGRDMLDNSTNASVFII